MTIKLDINDRAALAIKNHEKRVEIRANDNKYDYSKLNSNDIIEFNSNNIGIFYAKVKEANFYNSLEELFMLEGTRYTTSSTNDKDEAIKNVEKIGDYRESIKQNGVYAIHIEYLYSENTVWEELYNHCIEQLCPELESEETAYKMVCDMIERRRNFFSSKPSYKKLKKEFTL